MPRSAVVPVCGSGGDEGEGDDEGEGEGEGEGEVTVS